MIFLFKCPDCGARREAESPIGVLPEVPVCFGDTSSTLAFDATMHQSYPMARVYTPSLIKVDGGYRKDLH